MSKRRMKKIFKKYQNYLMDFNDDQIKSRLKLKQRVIRLERGDF